MQLVSSRSRARSPHVARRLPLRQEDYRERHDQQDGHAGEREGASMFEGHYLTRPSPMTGSHGGAWLLHQLLPNAAIAASRVA
jgi:hypothetical protein